MITLFTFKRIKDEDENKEEERGILFVFNNSNSTQQLVHSLLCLVLLFTFERIEDKEDKNEEEASGILFGSSSNPAR